MGRAKGSKNKPSAIKAEKPSAKKKVKEDPKKEKEVFPPKPTFAVSLIENPLLLCRACRESFETQEV